MPSEESELAWFSWRESFRRGCCAPWRGFLVLVGSRALWSAAVAPIAINLVVTTAASLAVLGVVAWGWARIHHWLRAGGKSWLWEAPAASISLVLAILGVAAAWSLLQTAVCGPWLERLVLRAEQVLGLPPEEFDQTSQGRLRTPADEHAALCGVFALLCVLLNCVPLLGAAGAVIAAVVAGSLITGRTLFSHPLALRSRSTPQGLAWCERHFWHTQGLGLLTLLGSLVPIVGGLVVASAAVGATLLFRELEATAGLVTPRAPRRPVPPAEMERVQG